MKFIDYLKNIDSDILEKIASLEDDALVDLLEKQSEYTVQLLFEKLSEEADAATIAPSTPVTGSQENTLMDDNNPTNSIKVNDVQAAVAEALAAGAADKIITFVQTLAQQNPAAINEVIKIIKVQLQSSYMNKQIDEETAVKVSDELNALLDGGGSK